MRKNITRLKPTKFLSARLANLGEPARVFSNPPYLNCSMEVWHDPAVVIGLLANQLVELLAFFLRTAPLCGSETRDIGTNDREEVDWRSELACTSGKHLETIHT